MHVTLWVAIQIIRAQLIRNQINKQHFLAKVSRNPFRNNETIPIKALFVLVRVLKTLSRLNDCLFNWYFISLCCGIHSYKYKTHSCLRKETLELLRRAVVKQHSAATKRAAFRACILHTDVFGVIWYSIGEPKINITIQQTPQSVVLLKII